MGEQVINYIRALPDTETIRVDHLFEDETLPIPFIASTEGRKSDGLNLKMADWTLGRFERYSPILWVHNYSHPPIGTGKARIGDALRIDVTFDTDDPFAMMIRNKAIKGMMGGSVGWARTEKDKNELVEFSMVPIGIDQESLPDIERMGYRAIQAQISTMLAEDPGESLQVYIKELRDEVMENILSILEEVVDEDVAGLTEALEDIERLEDPITLEIEEIEDPEDPEEAGDIERAGAMLSKKNRDDLKTALDLINGVIDRATPEEPVPSFSPMRGEEEVEEIIEVPIEEPEEVPAVEQRGASDEGLDPDIVAQIVEVLN